MQYTEQVNHVPQRHAHDAAEAQHLRRVWAHDPTARWLLALDAAIRRVAGAVGALFAG